MGGDAFDGLDHAAVLPAMGTGGPWSVAGEDDSDPYAAAEASARAQCEVERAGAERAVAVSDDALALRFTERHAGDLLHVAEWGKWLRWDGTRWAPDRTLAVLDMARKVCREGIAEAGGERGLAAQKVFAVVQLARSDRRHAQEGAAFDADPWLLNTPDGVVDLRTGTMRKHTKADLMTKIAGAAPAGECPRWLAFLAEVFQGDLEVIEYVQRWAGYMLTGLTGEHAFLFLLGPGGNGKGVIVATLSAALGDYATTAPMETFMQAQGERHPTDLAGLRGARLVVAQETEAGRALAEARIKALTGGDRISARFMRGDFFEFQPAFKLLMVGNHRPVIRSPDEAMRRRLHLLPMTFRPSHPNPDLPAALREELPGILAWAVAGCLAWQRDGLGMPALVRDATAEYFAEQDLITQWLAERCEARRDATEASSALFRDWTAWAQARGEAPGSNKAFSAALERLHAKRKGSHGRMEFVGLSLRPSDQGVW